MGDTGMSYKIPFQVSWDRVFTRIGLFIFLLFVFSPIVVFILDILKVILSGNDHGLELAIPTGRRFGLFIRTIGLSLSVALSSIIFGILAGSFLWRLRTGPASYLRWFVFFLLIIPYYVHALAWSLTIDKINSILEFYGLFTIPLQGWIGCWWVQLMALSPIAAGLTLLGLESIDESLIESARTLRSDVYCLKHVVLPLAAPMILAGGGFVFLFSLTDYSVPSLFQTNVYALEIFAEFSASNEPVRAFLLAIPFMCIACIIVYFSQSAIRNVVQKPLWHIRPRNSEMEWPWWFILLQYIAIIVLSAQILIPLISLFMDIGHINNLANSLASASTEIHYTFWVSIITAVLSIPVAFAVAKQLVKSGIQGKLWWFLVTLPLAVPASLVGIGLISIWNRPYLSVIYGSGTMLFLALFSRFVPIAAFVILAQLRRIEPLLLDAARIFQVHAIKTWIRINLPMYVPGFIAAGCIIFAMSAGELGATLIVAPPGYSTLTMRIYSYLHYGASESVAGLCFMMVLMALTLGLFAVIILRGKIYLYPRIRLKVK
jgi:iron(III) transport system permease protein